MKILITGVAGFIGSNLAHYFADNGHEVIGIDNLARPGSEKNIEWISKAEVYMQDILDIRELEQVDIVFHLAAQVGVQASIKNPLYDFNVNALGTVNLLEAVRKLKIKPHVIFASTNKVYGDFETDKPVNESQPLSFCTPYGCSKGAAEQYVLDYNRIYGIPTTVLRMSCIYGTRQQGTEEQGWLSHFVVSKLRDREVTLYGDGTQVRDVLFINDYVSLCEKIVESRITGVYNIGGGIENTISVKEALEKIGTKFKQKGFRPSDQKYYVSDLTKISKETNWKPTTSVEEGIRKLTEWSQRLV